MNKKWSNQFKSYLAGSMIMAIGLVFNLVEKDFVGSTIFFISSIVFLSLALIKKRATKENNA